MGKKYTYTSAEFLLLNRIFNKPEEIKWHPKKSDGDGDEEQKMFKLFRIEGNDNKVRRRNAKALDDVRTDIRIMVENHTNEEKINLPDNSGNHKEVIISRTNLPDEVEMDWEPRELDIMRLYLAHYEVVAYSGKLMGYWALAQKHDVFPELKDDEIEKPDSAAKDVDF